jgi:molybdate transport system ATP-binding protein
MSGRVVLSGPVSRDFTLDVAFDLPERGVTCLTGPSGSGKTSILRAVAGLDLLPGEVRFGGETWQDESRFVPPHKRPVGYVFQGGSLLPHLTVRSNLAYARKRAPDGPFDPARVVALTGIEMLLDRTPSRLSGGETQRASLARALLCQPRLLLMDEPLSALDSEARANLLEHFERVFNDFAVPALYVTHDRQEAERLGARMLRIRGGTLEGGRNG